MAQKVQAAVEVVGEVVEVVLDVIEPIQDPYQDRLYNAVKDTGFIPAIQREGRERPKVLFVEEAWLILNGRTRP